MTSPDPTPEPIPERRGCACRVIGILVAPVLVLGGCGAPLATGGGNSASSSPVVTGGESPKATTSVTDKYTQTWTKSYSTTTCEDWQESMMEAQTWAAAADILTSARNKIDGGSGLPRDSLVTSFRDDITEGCSADVAGLMITDVSYGVYKIGHDQYGP